MTIHKLEHVIVASLPKGATDLEIGQLGNECQFIGFTLPDGVEYMKKLPVLPNGEDYSHITRTLTEEECAREVKKPMKVFGGVGHFDYVMRKYAAMTTAHYSMKTLLSSLSISPDKAVFVHIDNMKK